MSIKLCTLCVTPFMAKPSRSNGSRFCSKQCFRIWNQRSDRFDDKYTPEPNTGCWLWYGATTCRGYGLVRFQNKTWYAHRLFWFLRNGQIPDGRLLCHHCDTPACVNPDHLFLGTHKDNADDMVKKNRQGDRRGERNSNVILSASQVSMIRNLRGIVKGKTIAAMMQVSSQLISAIHCGKLWSGDGEPELPAGIARTH